jgi:SAM-dependent methyltransferase
MDPVFETAAATLRSREGKIIDLGCGLGLLAFWFRYHDLNQDFVGYDQSEWKVRAGLAAARRLDYTNVEFHTKNMLEVDLCGAAAVCAFDVLHYLPGREQRQFLQNLAAAAKSGAVVLFRTGVRNQGWRSWATLLEEVWTRASGWIRGGSINFPTLEYLETIFRQEGCVLHSQPLWGRTPFSSYWCRVESTPIGSPPQENGQKTQDTA